MLQPGDYQYKNQNQGFSSIPSLEDIQDAENAGASSDAGSGSQS
jgi:hypothetical protein